MSRHDLTDFEWSVIEPLLPQKPRGVPRVDDRRVLNGIFWRFRTGSIPERYGPARHLLQSFRTLELRRDLGQAADGNDRGL